MADRRVLVAGVAVVLVAAVVIIAASLRHHSSGDPAPSAAAAATSRTGAATDTPARAMAAVRELTAGTSADSQRRALAPAVAAGLPPGRLFPAGTSFTPRAGSWVQSGDYAHLTGTLREPGAAPAQAEIGLMLSGGRWLVTFEEPS